MKVEFSDDQEGEKYRHPGNQVRIVNLAARGMLVVSVARHAGFCAIHLRNRLEGRPGDPEAIRRLILAGGEVRRFRPSVSAPGRRGHRARYRSLRFRGLKSPEQKSLTEATGWPGSAGLKIRQQMAFVGKRQGPGDEGRGAVRSSSFCGSD